jgi:hypothetical protein
MSAFTRYQARAAQSNGTENAIQALRCDLPDSRNVMYINHAGTAQVNTIIPSVSIEYSYKEFIAPPFWNL